MEIADWLRGLSLERYAETFRANAIDVTVWPELSESDLEKLGVLLGHRKISVLRSSRELAASQTWLTLLTHLRWNGELGSNRLSLSCVVKGCG